MSSEKPISDPCSDADFRAAVTHLRAICPPPRGCSLRVTRVEDLDKLGYTSKSRRAFLIEVRADLCIDLSHVILIHEWAHMLDWRAPHPLARDHSATWGVLRAQIYCLFHGLT